MAAAVRPFACAGGPFAAARRRSGRLSAESGRQDPGPEVGGRGRDRQQREEGDDGIPRAGLGADRAPVDVASHPLADEDREGAVPVGQEFAKRRAVGASHPRDGQCAKAALDPLTHPMHQHVALGFGDAEGVGEIAALQALASDQFQDELVAVVEPGGGGSDG